jgi:hypothetical protein
MFLQAFFILVNIFAICICSFGYGSLLEQFFFKKKIITIFEKVFVGIYLISILGLIINFFYKINSSISYVIFLLGFGYGLNIVFNKIEKTQYKKILVRFFLLSCLCLILIIFSKLQQDYPWYSIPFISYISSEKISFGISNVQFRFGHISILDYSSAIFGQIFTKNNIILPNVVSAVSLLLFFFQSFLNHSKKNSERHSLLFIFFITSYFLLKFNKFSQYGNDIPAQIIFFYIVLKILEIYESTINEERFEKIKAILLAFTFMTLQKVTLLSTFPILLILVFYSKDNLKYFYKIIILCFCINILWILKNLINTGCLIYPIDITCINHLEWVASENFHGNAKQVSNLSEAWSKGWIDQKNNILSYKNYIKNHEWIRVWFSKHFFVVFEKLIPLFVLMLFVVFLKKDPISKKIIYKKEILTLIFCLLLSTLTWFFKFPIFRYGMSIISSFLIITFLFFLSNLELKKAYPKLKVIIFICLSFFIFNNILRIYGSSKMYAFTPWPKIFSQNDNKKKEYEIIKSNGKHIILYPKDLQACYYSTDLCTHHREIKKNILIKEKKYGYIQFYNK